MWSRGGWAPFLIRTISRSVPVDERCEYILFCAARMRYFLGWWQTAYRMNMLYVVAFFQFHMKMDIHAMFNFSSVAYVASGIDGFFHTFFDEVSKGQIYGQ